jgi:elongation factor G
MAIEAKSKSDEDKLGEALGRIAAEDPTFEVSTDPQTGQQIIAGMGELHLEIIKDRLEREFGVAPNVGRPQVAYRETIQVPAEGEGRYVKQTGGHGQYGHVKFRLEPADDVEGIEFESKIKGGIISPQFISAIETGVREAALAGTLGGYPVERVRVILVNGSEHEVDSSDMAFRIAGSIGFRETYAKGHPVLLEPIMAVEVITPEEYMGDVIADLSARRATINSMTPAAGKVQIIEALVPLSNMFGYSTSVRSVSQGRATYSMQPDSYRVLEGAPAGK